MGKATFKSGHRNGAVKIVYSVCGHRERRQQNEEADPRQCLLGTREIWLPENTECRAGWCLRCTDHCRRHQLDTMDENVIQRYWNYMAKHKWTKPVDPSKFRTSALSTGTLSTSTKQWPAQEGVAACLYSLNIDASTTPSRARGAATTIRDGTLAWVSRVKAEAQARVQQQKSEYLRTKPHPVTPDLRQHSWKASTFSGGEATQMNILEQLNTAIDESLQELQWASGVPKTEAFRTEWTPNSWKGYENTQFVEDSRHFYAGDEEDDGMYFPGAGSFGPPSRRSPRSPPPRPSQRLARCQIHGDVDSSKVDMSCEVCAWIWLDESTVPSGSPLGRRSCDMEFLQSSKDVSAIHEACYCTEGALRGATCKSCLARRDFSLRTGVAWI